MQDEYKKIDPELKTKNFTIMMTPKQKSDLKKVAAVMNVTYADAIGYMCGEWIALRHQFLERRINELHLLGSGGDTIVEESSE